MSFEPSPGPLQGLEIPLAFSFLPSFFTAPPSSLLLSSPPPPFLHPPSLTSLFSLSSLQTKKFKIPAIRASRKPSRRGSTLSLTRTSGGSSPQSSMISVNPGSDEPPSVATGSKDIEDTESWSTKHDEETLLNLHTSKSYPRSHHGPPLHLQSLSLSCLTSSPSSRDTEVKVLHHLPSSMSLGPFP